MSDFRRGQNGEEVRIEPEGLDGLLGIPDGATGIVIFAHGSGSGRLSPRNNYVATALRNAGLATFLLDLLRPDEERDRRNVFDIDLLASRLVLATRWVGNNPGTPPISSVASSVRAPARLPRSQRLRAPVRT